MSRLRKVWHWLVGDRYIVIKGDWDNAYPCKVNKYMVFNPRLGLVWETDLTKEAAEHKAKYLNRFI